MEGGKFKLNKFFRERQLPVPNYVLMKKEGPDHFPVFTVACSVHPEVHKDGSIRDETTEGQGLRIKIASNLAAEKLYNILKGIDDIKVLKLDNPSTCPRCLKVFHDGYFHLSAIKLAKHMKGKYL